MMKARKKSAAAKKPPAKRGLQSPAARLFMGATAAIAGGILAGLWAIGRRKT